MAQDRNLELVREYFEISNKLQDTNSTLTQVEKDKLLFKQVELACLINSKSIDLNETEEVKIKTPLTVEEKLDLYLQGKAHLIPDDSYGRIHGGKILPTEEEVAIGMYPDRSLFYFEKYTCGIYRYYSVGLPFEFNYIGYSQYIEYALHAQHCRRRSEKNNPDKPRKRKGYIAKSLSYMLDKYPNNIRFEIIEEVPYSLLSAACYNQRQKHKCLWQYNMTNKDGRGFDPEKLEAGEYNY